MAGVVVAAGCFADERDRLSTDLFPNILPLIGGPRFVLDVEDREFDDGAGSGAGSADTKLINPEVVSLLEVATKLSLLATKVKPFPASNMDDMND